MPKILSRIWKSWVILFIYLFIWCRSAHTGNSTKPRSMKKWSNNSTPNQSGHILIEHLKNNGIFKFCNENTNTTARGMLLFNNWVKAKKKNAVKIVLTMLDLYRRWSEWPLSCRGLKLCFQTLVRRSYGTRLHCLCQWNAHTWMKICKSHHLIWVPSVQSYKVTSLPELRVAGVWITLLLSIYRLPRCHGHMPFYQPHPVSVLIDVWWCHSHFRQFHLLLVAGVSEIPCISF